MYYPNRLIPNRNISAPHHKYDLLKWRVFADQPNIENHYGKFTCWWVIVISRYYQMNEAMIFLSWDGGISYVSYDYQWIKTNPVINEEFNSEVLAHRKLYQKEQAKNRAKLSKELNECLAKEQGITVEELKKNRNQYIKNKRAQNKTKKQIEQLNRIVKIGPELKGLKDDLDFLLKRLIDVKDLFLTNPDNNLRHIRHVRKILQKWAK